MKEHFWIEGKKTIDPPPKKKQNLDGQSLTGKQTILPVVIKVLSLIYIKINVTFNYCMSAISLWIAAIKPQINKILHEKTI